MSDQLWSMREADDELISVDTDEEHADYLDAIAPHIGWIIIYFNSLEGV